MELANDCARVCHVLTSATEGGDVDNLSGPSGERIEDLGRYVCPTQLSAPDRNELYQNYTPRRVHSQRTRKLRSWFAGTSPWAHR